jgi:hypothetical protein
MIRFATALVGHRHGGLALGGALACALVAAVSGNSPATVVAIGSILLPATIKQGNPRKFGVGVIGTAGALRRASSSHRPSSWSSKPCRPTRRSDSSSWPASSPACCSRPS